MRQWKSLVPSLHLHTPSPPSCFPQPPSPSPCPSPPRADTPPPPSPPEKQVVRLVGTDGRVRAYPPPVTARELMQEHPCHLVCRSDALLIGEKIPAVAAGEELVPGEAYFLLPSHLFHSVVSFVSLASSLLLVLNKAAAEDSSAAGGGKAAGKPFELLRNASGALQIKFSDDFLAGWDEEEVVAPAAEEAPAAVLLRGDKRLAKDYEELVGYSKSRRWAPKLETIEEVVTVAATAAAAAAVSPKPSPERKKSRGALPFLGRLGSRRRQRDACGVGGSAAVACSG